MSWPDSSTAAEPLWAVVGSTGTGKTRLAIELAERVGGEIVSVDSAQVFIGLDIGTAKPTPEERARVPHHIIDVIPPTTQWSGASFAAAAEDAIAAIRSRGKRPILCGGTGLWLRALVRGFFEAPPIREEIRAEVRRKLELLGAPAVHAELTAVDPLAGARLHPNDTQRIGRALEVFLETGVPISRMQDEHGFRQARHPWRAVALDWPRERLVAHLDARTRGMYRAGLIEETRAILAQGVDPAAPGLGAIGYREAVQLLAGKLTEAEAIEATVIATRQYAKRQRNWFKHDAEVDWLPPEATAEDARAVLERGAHAGP